MLHCCFPFINPEKFQIFGLVFFCSLFLLTTSVLFRQPEAPSTIGIELGVRVRPSPLSLALFILRRKLFNLLHLSLYCIQDLFGWIAGLARILAACAVEIWTGLGIIADATQLLVGWMLGAGMKGLRIPLQSLLSSLCNDLPELSNAGICDGYT